MIVEEKKNTKIKNYTVYDKWKNNNSKKGNICLPLINYV